MRSRAGSEGDFSKETTASGAVTRNAGPSVPTPRRCANCDAALTGRYCASCGQDSRDANVTLREWFRESAAELLSVDARIVRTLRLLLTRPGAATVEWARGRRTHWVRPFRLYLVGAFVFFTTAALYYEGGGALAGLLAGFFHERGSGAGGAAPTSGEVEAFAASLEAYLPRVVLLLVPVSALLLKAIHRKARLHYVVHLVFALHFHAVFFVLRALAIPVPEPVGTFFEFGASVAIVTYLVLATRRVYGRSTGAALATSGVFMLTYGLIVVTATLLAGVIFLGPPA
jgi:Protein of unknown function (DUF3667)